MSLGNASLASCSKTGEGWRDGERERGEEKTLTKALRINKQPPLLDESHPTFVEYRRQCLSEYTSRWVRQKRGEVKIEDDEMRRRKTKSRSIIKNPSWVLRFCPSSHRAIVCLSVCVCINCVQMVCACICVHVLVSCTDSIHYSRVSTCPLFISALQMSPI